MKNFPDHNQFDELEKRLQAYTEQPDASVWENIDSALRPHRTPAWIPWADHFTSVIAILLFAFVSGGIQSTVSDSGKNKEKASVTPPGINNKSLFEQSMEIERDERDAGKLEKSSAPVTSKEDFYVESKPRVQSAGNMQEIRHNLKLDTATLVLTKPAVQKEISVDKQTNDTLIVTSLKMQVDSSSQNRTSLQKPKSLPKKGLTFYVSVTPSLSFQRVIPVSRDGVIVNEFYNHSILSAERFGLSLDAGVQGLITKRFEYYGGISFYRQSQTLRYLYQSESQVTLESTGDLSYAVTPKSSIGIVNYDMVNLGVQGGVLYYLYGKMLTHKIGAGLLYQHGFKKSDSEVYKNSESSYFSYQLFYRNELRMSARLRIFVQPVFTQTIHVRETLNAPFNLKPYRAGIAFGVLYDF